LVAEINSGYQYFIDNSYFITSKEITVTVNSGNYYLLIIIIIVIIANSNFKSFIIQISAGNFQNSSGNCQYQKACSANY